MSPRAAWRLDHLGFEDVCDYGGGKMDWLGYGLDYEGSADLITRHLVDPMTCCTGDRLGDMRSRAAPEGECFVVDNGVLVGSVDLEVDANDDARVGDVATFGVSTVRPSQEREDLAQKLRQSRASRAVVTDPNGRLLGLFRPMP
jgi:hypothetical protein